MVAVLCPPTPRCDFFAAVRACEQSDLSRFGPLQGLLVFWSLTVEQSLDVVFDRQQLVVRTP